MDKRNKVGNMHAEKQINYLDQSVLFCFHECGDHA